MAIASIHHAILLSEESAVPPFLSDQNRQKHSTLHNYQNPVRGVIRSASLSCHNCGAHLRCERRTMTHKVQISEAQALSLPDILTVPLSPSNMHI